MTASFAALGNLSIDDLVFVDGKYLVQVLQFIVVLILAARFTFSWRGWRRPLATEA